MNYSFVQNLLIRQKIIISISVFKIDEEDTVRAINVNGHTKRLDFLKGGQN